MQNDPATVDALACVFEAYAPYQYLWFASILNELGFALDELFMVIVDDVVFLATANR